MLANNLPKKYAAAFASPGTVGRYARHYWLTATDLNDGAAGALLQVLDVNAVRKTPRKLNAQQLVAEAVKQKLDSDERLKMQQIEWLEPFLADATLLFFLLVNKKSNSFNVVE